MVIHCPYCLPDAIGKHEKHCPYKGLQFRELAQNELIEELAALEHEQWIEWTRSVAQDLWPERRKRWQEYWVPYNQLPESARDFARKWAQKVLDLLETYKPKPAKTHGIEVIQPAHEQHLDSEKVSERK